MTLDEFYVSCMTSEVTSLTYNVFIIFYTIYIFCAAKPIEVLFIFFFVFFLALSISVLLVGYSSSFSKPYNVYVNNELYSLKRATKHLNTIGKFFKGNDFRPYTDVDSDTTDLSDSLC